jgi:hypothetical protein
MRIVAPTLALSLGLALPLLAMGQLQRDTDPPSQREPRPVTRENSCNSADYMHLIGRPAAEVEAVTFERPVRIIPLGAAVTMEFSPARINFELDGAGNVARIYCG